MATAWTNKTKKSTMNNTVSSTVHKNNNQMSDQTKATIKHQIKWKQQSNGACFERTWQKHELEGIICCGIFLHFCWLLYASSGFRSTVILGKMKCDAVGSFVLHEYLEFSLWHLGYCCLECARGFCGCRNGVSSIVLFWKADSWWYGGNDHGVLIFHTLMARPFFYI